MTAESLVGIRTWPVLTLVVFRCQRDRTAAVVQTCLWTYVQPNVLCWFMPARDPVRWMSLN